MLRLTTDFLICSKVSHKAKAHTKEQKVVNKMNKSQSRPKIKKDVKKNKKDKIAFPDLFQSQNMSNLKRNPVQIEIYE